jgi:CHAT domain
VDELSERISAPKNHLRLYVANLSIVRDTLFIPPDGKTVAFVTNEDGVSRLHLLDSATCKDTAITSLPIGIISDLRWHNNYVDLAFNLKSPQTPNDIYSVDARGGKIERWSRAFTALIDVDKLPKPEIIHWNSFDGRVISGILYRPTGTFNGKRPVIIDIHGGPEEQYRPGFGYHDSYFVNELGVVKIFPNVRGSTGYGKSFVNLDNGLLRMNAIGNPAIGGEALTRALSQRNAPFAPLPESEKEAQTLASEVYGVEASTVRVGNAAREATVKAELGKYHILHFATHGVLENENPLYSYIVLAQGTDSNEDGLLEAWELMEMELKAELAVLSACDTARGRVGDGEGIIGMTWALFVAGVPTTVASQWKVPSDSTTKLMVDFHKNLVEFKSGRKVSKAEAWQQAALAMINDPRFRMKPYYWAGFVVLGDGASR